MIKNTVLYAVLDTATGMKRVRCSEALTQRVADDLFDAVYADNRAPQQRRDRIGRYTRKQRGIMRPGWKANGQPVSYFALRALDDPAWPASGPVHHLRDDHRIATV